jgi:radical SAM/Cys-rich protein
MNRFQEQLHTHNVSLTRGAFQTLQINVGRKCNQTCTHCHVDAGPHRTEMMDEATAHRVGAWIEEHKPANVDITGGAPELSEYFNYFVETARGVGAHVIDRNNLTIIETKSHAYLPEYLARHEVEVVASLPCYLEENVDEQRGDGVFVKSIRALRKLNAVGYGTKLPLTLVYNPIGPKLPPNQEELEADYKEELRLNATASSLHEDSSRSRICPSRASPPTCASTVTGTAYMDLLANSFNPADGRWPDVPQHDQHGHGG